MPLLWLIFQKLMLGLMFVRWWEGWWAIQSTTTGGSFFGGAKSFKVVQFRSPVPIPEEVRRKLES